MKTEFYNLLKKACTDEVSLVIVIDQIMPLINSNSIENGHINEELRSILIEHVIRLIKNEKFADMLLK